MTLETRPNATKRAFYERPVELSGSVETWKCDQTGGFVEGDWTKAADSLLCNATKRANRCDLRIDSGRIKILPVWIT